MAGLGKEGPGDIRDPECAGAGREPRTSTPTPVVFGPWEGELLAGVTGGTEGWRRRQRAQDTGAGRARRGATHKSRCGEHCVFSGQGIV